MLGWVGEVLLEEICTARISILLFKKCVLPWSYRVQVLITKKICCAHEHGVVLYRDSNHRKISPKVPDKIDGPCPDPRGHKEEPEVGHGAKEIVCT